MPIAVVTLADAPGAPPPDTITLLVTGTHTPGATATSNNHRQALAGLQHGAVSARRSRHLATREFCAVLTPRQGRLRDVSVKPWGNWSLITIGLPSVGWLLVFVTFTW